MFKPGLGMNRIEQRRPFGAEGSSVGWLTGIASNVNDPSGLTLCQVSSRIHDDAAPAGAVGAGVARLGRTYKLEGPDRRRVRRFHRSKPKGAKRRAGKTRSS